MCDCGLVMLAKLKRKVKFDSSIAWKFLGRKGHVNIKFLGRTRGVVKQMGHSTRCTTERIAQVIAKRSKGEKL